MLNWTRCYLSIIYNVQTSFEVGQIWPHFYPLLHFNRNTQKKVVRLKFRDEKLIKRFHSVSSSTIIDFRAFYRKKSPLLKTSTTRKNESVALKLLDVCHTGTAELREKWLRWMDTHCTKGKKELRLIVTLFSQTHKIREWINFGTFLLVAWCNRSSTTLYALAPPKSPGMSGSEIVFMVTDFFVKKMLLFTWIDLGACTKDVQP